MDIQYAPFLAGILAGFNGTIVGHPFDTLKTRYQVGKSIDLKLNFNLIKQLYRGILPPLLTSGGIQSINFLFYENFRIRLKSIGMQYNVSLLNNDISTIFIAGSCSGSLVSIISNPISIIKIRQQVDSLGNVKECIKDVYNHTGMKGFYRGYGPMLVLDASRGLYFAIYEVMKRSVVKIGNKIEVSIRRLDSSYQYNSHNNTSSNNNSSSTISGSSNSCSDNSSGNNNYKTSVISTTTATTNNNTVYKNSSDPFFQPNGPSTRVVAEHPFFQPNGPSTRMVAAAITGIISWIIIYPIDVIRVRLHLDYNKIKYTTWYNCIKYTYKEGGYRMFYRGLSFTLIRAGPVSAASLTSYEYAKDLFELL